MEWESIGMGEVDQLVDLVEQLRPDDMRALLSNRGYASSGPDAPSLVERELMTELTRWRWQRFQPDWGEASVCSLLPATLFACQGNAYVFSTATGEEEERPWLLRVAQPRPAPAGRSPGTSQLLLSRIEVIGTPPQMPALRDSLQLVLGSELWLFPQALPRDNHAFVLDMSNLCWFQRNMEGQLPPPELDLRTASAAVVHENAAFIGEKDGLQTVHWFHPTSCWWSCTSCEGAPGPGWVLKHFCAWKGCLMALGHPAQAAAEWDEPTDGAGRGPVAPKRPDRMPGDRPHMEVWRMDVKKLTWERVEAQGPAPPLLKNSSGAVVGSFWVIHGGTLAGKAGQQSLQSHAFNLESARWQRLPTDAGAAAMPRQGHSAVGVTSSTMVVMGGQAQAQAQDWGSSAAEACWDVEVLTVLARTRGSQPVGQAKLLGSLRSLFGCPHLADVTLVIGAGASLHQLPAHRVVLAAHSKVFERMFMAEMLERKTAEVKIPNVEPDVMHIVLAYMYGCFGMPGKDPLGELQPPRGFQQLLNVFRAAHLYQVDGLMLEMVQRIHAQLKAELVVDDAMACEQIVAGLQTAAELEHEGLFAVLVEVGVELLPDVLQLPSFKRLVQSEPDKALRFIYTAIPRRDARLQQQQQQQRLLCQPLMRRHRSVPGSACGAEPEEEGPGATRAGGRMLAAAGAGAAAAGEAAATPAQDGLLYHLLKSSRRGEAFASPAHQQRKILHRREAVRKHRMAQVPKRQLHALGLRFHSRMAAAGLAPPDEGPTPTEAAEAFIAAHSARQQQQPGQQGQRQPVQPLSLHSYSRFAQISRQLHELEAHAHREPQTPGQGEG